MVGRRSVKLAEKCDAGTMKSAVEAVFENFKPSRRLREANEARTRVELVDAVLDAVGWSVSDIDREVPSGTGEFLDYELWARDQPWMVLEAKRVGQTFDISEGSRSEKGRTRGVGGLLRTGGNALRETLKQASSYCNDRGIPLACATNGFQWVFFRGLSSKSKAWKDGQALVFSSHKEVLARFDEFVRCLAKGWAGSPYLLETLELPHGRGVPEPANPRDHLTMRRRSPDPDRIAVVRSVCDYLLSDIFGEDRREMLARCYVTPGIAGDFEHSIQRLLKDSAEDVDGEHDVQESNPEDFANALTKQAQLSTMRNPVVVVGHVGAGKTTFLQRTLAQLRDRSSAFCALVDLEGYGQGEVVEREVEERQVARDILEKLRGAAIRVLRHHRMSPGELAQADPHDPATLRTLLRDRIEKEKGVGAAVWDLDPDAWVRKEYELFQELREDAPRFLRRYVQHLCGRFKSYPVLIVLDNLDQASDEYQRVIYGFAQRLARQTRVVTVVCIREDTYGAGRQENGFLSSSPEQFVFHVASPPLDRLLRNRVKFGKVAGEEGWLPRGLRAETPALASVCKLLEGSLLARHSESLNVFAALAGPNMREALGLVRGLAEGAVGSPIKPDASAAFALDCLLVVQSPSSMRNTLRIANCFDAGPSEPPFHGLRLRLLAYFSWVLDQSERSFLEDPEAVIGRFSAWGYPAGLVRATMRQLLDQRLLDTSRRECEDDGYRLPRRVRITASGYVHLTRLSKLPAYRAAMACCMNWYDSELFRGFVLQASQAGGEEGLTIGDIQVSPALTVFEAYLARAVAMEDARLSEALTRHSWTREVRARSSALPVSGSARRTSPDPPPSSDARRDVLPNQLGKRQLLLPFPGEGSTRPVPELPTVRRNRECRGTVWIPRILWALEWARQHALGPQSPADIARVLGAHGQIDVPRNNVARAFRELRDTDKVVGLWKGQAKRYTIERAGIELLQSILEEDLYAPESESAE